LEQVRKIFTGKVQRLITDPTTPPARRPGGPVSTTKRGHLIWVISGDLCIDLLNPKPVPNRTWRMTMKDYRQIAKEYGEGYARLREGLEAPLAGFGELARGAVGDGALDRKTKELIGFAIAIITRCDGCIATHARSVVRAGASREEAQEVVAVAIFMGGGPASVYGVEAMRAFDQFAER